MSASGKGKKLIHFVLATAKTVVVAFAKVVSWSLVSAWKGWFVVHDLAHARHRIHGQFLICPRGHQSPIHGVFECSRCGYVYEGTALICGASECRATTTHTSCVVCGLSIRNPFRAGHP